MLCSVSCGDKDFLCLLLRQDQFGSGGIRIIVGQIAKCIRNSVEPVSYTQLDVYKRQPGISSGGTEGMVAGSMTSTVGTMPV